MPDSPLDSHNEKILIISSNAALTTELGKALRDAGYPTIIAKTGADATKFIYNMPHLILLDTVLDGADGYDILAQKHAEPLLSKIPLFLLSTQGVAINMRRVPQGSVAEFLMTPENTVGNILERVNRRFGHAASVVAGKPTPAGSKKKILWVEDDNLLGTILAKKISASDFDLTLTKNGEDALLELAAMIPDAIVLDLLLPGMNGFEILQKIRMDERLKSVPVLILSNLGKQSDIDKAKTLGAKKFLVKAATSLDQIVLEVKEASK